MRGQVSLELLIILLSSVVALSIFIPSVGKAKQTSDYALASRNAQLILDKLHYSCERAHIWGENQTVVVRALFNYSIANSSSSLAIKFDNKTITGSGFRCSVDQNLSKGTSSVVLSPDD